MTVKKITKEQIDKMTYQQMIKLCPQLGVKYTYQKKDILHSALIEALNNGGKPIEKDEEKEVPQYSKEVMEIVDDSDLSKSDKMRELYDLGITAPSEIAKLTNAHYSFVYTVISKYKGS